MAFGLLHSLVFLLSFFTSLCNVIERERKKNRSYGWVGFSEFQIQVGLC